LTNFFKCCVWAILILPSYTWLMMRETTWYAVILTHKNGGHSFQLLEVRNHSSFYYLTHNVYQVRIQILVVNWNNLGSLNNKTEIILAVNALNQQSCFCQHFNKMSWSWSYGSWNYNYLCNQCLSPLTVWVRTPLRRDVLDKTLCDKVSQWLVAGCSGFFPGTPIFCSKLIDSNDIAEILLKMASKTIAPH